MERVEIPGGHALLRDTLTVAGRKIVERTSIVVSKAQRRVRVQMGDEAADAVDENTPAGRLPYTEAELEAFQRFEMAGFVALVHKWTLPIEIPRTIDEVGELDPDVYDPIAAAVRKRLPSILKRPDASMDAAVDEQGRPIADSPTGPSTDSHVGGGESPSTPPSESGIVPSPTSPESSDTGGATAA